jgi:nucleoside-diphosphate-sugar epimerase
MGIHVTALGIRKDFGPWDNFVVCDVTRPFDSDVFAGHEIVFHLAGKVHALAEVAQDEMEYFRVNTKGTQNVLEASKAAGVRRFVFFSTIKAMSRDGDRLETIGIGMGKRAIANNGPLSETDGVEPDTPYGRSKLEAERLVLEGGYIPEPVVLRLSMVYGAGAKGNVNRMLKAVSRKRFPPLPEFGNRRSMVHVHDVVQAAVLAAQKREAIGHIFIISDGRAYSTRQIYECMCRFLNCPYPRWTVPKWSLRVLGFAGDAIGHLSGRRFVFDSASLSKLVGSAWYSSNKIKSLLGFSPRWDLESAMPEMIVEMHNRKKPGKELFTK